MNCRLLILVVALTLVIGITPLAADNYLDDMTVILPSLTESTEEGQPLDNDSGPDVQRTWVNQPPVLPETDGARTDTEKDGEESLVTADATEQPTPVKDSSTPQAKPRLNLLAMQLRQVAIQPARPLAEQITSRE